jgi:hypothetical protein
MLKAERRIGHQLRVSDQGRRGVTNIRTYVNPTNRNHVSISTDVADMDALMAALESEAGVAAMEYDGVLGETLVIYVQG